MKSKFVKITSVILTIFIILTILGFYHSHYTEFEEVDNPQKQFKYNDHLYFYDGNKLLGKYKCENTVCDYAELKIDDAVTELDYYKNDDIKSSIINKRYVFINDNNIILYDLKNNVVVNTYERIKNYVVGIESNRFIVCNKLCGVINLSNEFVEEIPLTYDFIGLINNLDPISNKLIADRYVVKKLNKWFIIDNNNQLISNDFNESIVTYNGKYIVTKEADSYSLFDFDGEKVLNEDYRFISFTENYVNLVNLDNQLYVYDIEKSLEISTRFHLSSNNYEDLFTTKLIDGDKLELTIDTDQEVTTYNYDLN